MAVRGCLRLPQAGICGREILDTMNEVTAPYIIRYPAQVPEHLRGGVVSLGNFDGVHLGHQQVLAAAKQAGKGLPLTVVSFYPHPVQVLRGISELRTLSSLREKREKFAARGVRLLYGIHFTRDFSRVTADQFIQRVLVEALAAKIVVVGEDVAIGHNREGNLEYLQRALPSYGITLLVVPKLELQGVRPSSRRIRQLLVEGEVKEAAELLGEPFTVSARVGHGDKRGSKIGFPTANLACRGRLLPKRGVYACRVTVKGRSYNAVVNIGVRPTFNGSGERIEVHIPGESLGTLYGERMWVSFLARLRDERKFSSIEELKTQIGVDIVEAEKRLRDGHSLA